MMKHRRGKFPSKKKAFEPVVLRGLSVEPERFRTFEAAMNKFSRLVQEDGKMDVVRAKTRYEKPSVTKRRKKSVAVLKEKYRREKESVAVKNR